MPTNLFANASADIIAKKLLTPHHFRRISACKNLVQCLPILRECGYDVPIHNEKELTAQDIDNIASAELINAVNTFARLAPNKDLLACVMLKFEYHNARATIKAKLSGNKINSAIYPFKNALQIANAINNDDYSHLSPIMSTAIRDILEIENVTSSEIDDKLNVAFEREILMHARKIPNNTIRDYFLSAKDKRASYKFSLTHKSLFSLEFLFNWFMIKQDEIMQVRTMLINKKLGIRGKWWQQIQI